jgi:ABC-2 type transport system permease protein
VSTFPAISADSESGTSALASSSASYPFTRLMLWRVRCEFWENRSIYIAPFATALFLVFVVLFTVMKAGISAQTLGVTIGPAMLWIPYMLIAAPVLAIGVFVALAYCLGALHSERQDRSILFWKSLPVSDLITVLSKASVPIILIPLISFVAAMIAQLVIFEVTSIVFPLFAAKGHFVWAGAPADPQTVGMLWAEVPIGYLALAMLYGLLATALWHAPIYAWLLLVGGWARRMTLVWAVAPIAGLVIVERIAFRTDHLGTMLNDRLSGSLPAAFTSFDVGNRSLPDIAPGQFLSDPGLWIGLAVAALLFGAAVLLRRYRQPI